MKTTCQRVWQLKLQISDRQTKSTSINWRRRSFTVMPYLAMSQPESCTWTHHKECSGCPNTQEEYTSIPPGRGWGLNTVDTTNFYDQALLFKNMYDKTLLNSQSEWILSLTSSTTYLTCSIGQKEAENDGRAEHTATIKATDSPDIDHWPGVSGPLTWAIVIVQWDRTSSFEYAWGSDSSSGHEGH